MDRFERGVCRLLDVPDQRLGIQVFGECWDIVGPRHPHSSSTNAANESSG